MLDALRKGAATWVAKVFIALLVISFGIWGVNDIFGGYGQKSLGSVGDVEITEADYQRAYQNEIQLLSQQLRRQVTPQMARNLGIESRVLTRLVAGAALESHANTLGLGVSDKTIANLIHRDPAFQDSSGKFSRLAFDSAMRNAGLSEEGYLIERRHSALRGQLTGVIANTPPVNNTMLSAWNKYWNAKREVEYFVLKPEAVGKIETPGEDVLRKYYEDNKGRYTAPEYREIAVLLVDPELLKEQIKISDDLVKKTYDANLDRYKVPEKRKVEQIPFPDKAAAEAAYKKLQEGTTFAAIAKERGLGDGDYSLGTVTKSELLDKDIAEAAFALKANEISKPVTGRLATVLLRVTDITPGLTRTFDEMKDKIRENMQKEQATDKVLELYDVIEDARAEGTTLKEIADKQNLKFFSATSDKSGKGTDGKEIEDLKGKQAVLTGAFQSDVGVENDAAELYGGAYAWYEVKKVTASRQKTFEDAKAEIEKNWLASETEKKLADKAKELVDKGNSGESLADLAKSVGAKVEKPLDFPRSANLKSFPRAGVAQAFSMDKGKFGSAAFDDEDARAVFQLSKIIAPPELIGDNKKKSEERITSGLVDDILGQYLSGLQNDYGTSLNQQTLNRLTGAGEQN